MPTDTSGNSSSPEPLPSSPKYLSKRGAFNGTGISVMEYPNLVNLTSGEIAPGPNVDGNLLLVFQHHTGQVRWMRRVYPDSWQGGSAYDVVATDAKNATPIALRANALGQHHVFCKYLIRRVFLKANEVCRYQQRQFAAAEIRRQSNIYLVRWAIE